VEALRMEEMNSFNSKIQKPREESH
jgi:hypothetical protein